MIEQATRKIRISRELMATMLTRDHEGRPLRVDWGEADDDGFYEPLITVEEDTFSRSVVALRDVAERAREYLDFSGPVVIHAAWCAGAKERVRDDGITELTCGCGLYEHDRARWALRAALKATDALTVAGETHRTTEGK